MATTPTTWSPAAASAAGSSRAPAADRVPSGALGRKDGEIIRALASVSVVVAHCIHYWVKDFSRHKQLPTLDYLAALADQLTRFTVPAFLFLSGFGLILQVRSQGLDPRRYYRTRLVKIAAPFLLWSSLTSFRHVEYFRGLDWEGSPWSSLGDCLFFLFVRGFDYQYYFLIVIFQFYLVFPFVYRLARSRAWMAAFLLGHLCLLSPVEFYLQIFHLQLPHFHAHFILFHWFYCFAGMYVAWNREALAGLVRRWTGPRALAFWVLCFGLLCLEFTLNILGGKSLGDSDHFNRWSVVLYCLASLLVFVKAAPYLEVRLYHTRAFAFIFSHVAPYTFFVYLGHTHILRFVEKNFPHESLFDMILRTGVVVGGSYCAAWLLQALLQEWPFLRLCLGLPKKGTVGWLRPGWARLPEFRFGRPAVPARPEARSGAAIVRTRLRHWFGTPGFARGARGLFTPLHSPAQSDWPPQARIGGADRGIPGMGREKALPVKAAAASLRASPEEIT